MESQVMSKVHNFGIYRKGGKRCILQLDFPGRALLVIQKGHIKKTHPMSALDHYDSEDGLHIGMKLKDGEMVFEADNMEEKCTICCLLGLVMQIGQEGDVDSIDHHLDNSDVIKDGLLEKKGHTTITTWNKRRIRLTPGELSYFKPGEELALNVIQLWKDNCVLKKHQHNGFNLTIRSRVYRYCITNYCQYFRTLHDFKATHMTEIARDDWYEAFEKAMSLQPTTSKIMDMNLLNGSPINMRHNDTNSSIDSTASNRSSRSSSSSTCRDPYYDSTPDVLEQFMASSYHYTDTVPKSFRSNTLPAPPKTASPTKTTGVENKHILAFLRRSQSSENLLDSPALSDSRPESREFHGLSPLTTRRQSKGLFFASSASTSNLLDCNSKGDVFSGSAASFRAKLAEKGGKSSSLKNYRANKEQLVKAGKTDGMKRGLCKAYNMFLIGADFRARSLDRNPNRAAPQVHPIIDIPEKKNVQSQDNCIYSEAKPSLPIIVTPMEVHSSKKEEVEEISLVTPLEVHSSKKEEEEVEEVEEVKEFSTFSSSSLMPSTEAATLLIRDKPISSPADPITADTRQAPPLPEAPPPLSRHAKIKKKSKDNTVIFPPAIPSPCPPPPPPRTIDTSCDIDSSSHRQLRPHGLRLKQIHWTKINHNQIASSLWKDIGDVTDKLDLMELEEQFAVVSSKSSMAKNNNQQDKQSMLVDAKRAQNLGILFCGLKLDNIHKLMEALNSATELDSFPVDKLATLKRYQPTTEELEMYRDHAKNGETLHDADKFMVELCQIPKLGVRLDLVLTLWEFPGQCVGLEEELTDILAASDQLLASASLARVLEYILAIGNFMNSTWGCKEDAGGFQLSSLDKILSVKGRDSKATLCGYLVKQLRRSDPSLVAWPDTVEGVSKCSGYSVKAVGAEIDVLKNDLHKIKRTLKVLRPIPSLEKGFLLDVQNFIMEHDRKLDQLEIQYVKVSNKYKELMVRFGEPVSNSSESIFSMVCGFVDKFNQAKLQQELP